MALVELAGKGEMPLISQLISTGADVNARGEHGYTGECAARGARAAGADTERGPALIRAAEFGRLDCVQLLVESGAKIDLKDSSGYTALHLASMHGET